MMQNNGFVVVGNVLCNTTLAQLVREWVIMYLVLY